MLKMRYGNLRLSVLCLLNIMSRIFPLSAIRSFGRWLLTIQQVHPCQTDHISILLKTTDGGTNWDTIHIEEAEGRIVFDIYAFDEDTACITTQDFQSPAGRGVFRTTNGGTDWTQVQYGDEGGVWIHFFDDLEGVCINASSATPIAYTLNGGIDWTEGDIPELLPNEGSIISTTGTSLEAVGDILWFGTDLGRIFKSTDRGQTWNAYPMDLGGDYIYSVAFVDEQNGIALHGTNYQLAKTSDGGMTWSAVNYPFQFYEVIAIPCSRVFMGVNWEDGKTITAISTDLGETWEELDNTISVWAPNFKSPSIGWMAEGGETGTNAVLYKWVGDTLYGRTYVNHAANGNNDGTSWADAYTDLQTALQNADEEDEIWVAEGTYTPDTMNGSTFSTFFIDKDLQLYGGFAGTECNLSERDIEQYPTILSGDLDSNDVVDDFDNYKSDNVLHVVTATAQISNLAVIDGFTIQGGYADNEFATNGDEGGGIFSEGLLNIRNCLFTQNYAENKGGGLLAINLTSAVGATLKVEHCTFTKNMAMRGGGANIEINALDAEFSVTDCTFHQNTTFPSPWGCGSGLEAILRGENGNFELRNSTFTENSGAVYGGGAGIFGAAPSVNGTVVVNGCLFESNTSGNSGGLAVGSWQNAGMSEYSITNCQFQDNIVDNYAGGLDLYSDSPSIITVEDCHLEGNMAGEIAGGIGIATNTSGFQVVARNCTLIDNDSPSGSAIGATPETNEPGSTQSASIIFENCLVYEHTGNTTIALQETGNIQLLNCTIADNEGMGITLDSTSAITLQNTIFYNPGFMEYDTLSEGNVTSLGGNLFGDESLGAAAHPNDMINSNPLFVEMGNECEYYQLSEDSPAIDGGVELVDAPDYDLCGNDRVITTCVDIGALESEYGDATDCIVKNKEVLVDESLIISPNPVMEYLMVQFPEAINRPVAISLFDAQGILIDQMRIDNGESIDVVHLPPGMYLLKGVNDNTTYTAKFIKQ